MSQAWHKGSRRQKLSRVGAAVAVGGMFSVAACTTLPGDSAPEAISSYSSAPDVEDVVEPKQDQAPDLLLRDFFAASAHPVNDHSAARRFLTPETAGEWRPEEKMKILDRVLINSEGANHDGRVTYRVRGNVVGSVAPGGVFEPEYMAYETTYEMEQVDGQWRIANLRDGVVLDRTDFTAAYDARNVYFVDPGGSMLVPDRRWVYARQQSAGTSLISLLTAGPQPRLKGAVSSLVPRTATVRAQRREDGAFEVEFKGLSGLNADARRLLGAQVVWTLAGADVRGPYRLMADGAVLSEEVGELWHINDVSQYDPRASVAAPLRAVADGQVRELEENTAEATTMGGWLGSNYIEALDVSAQENMFAAVAGSGEGPRKLLAGKPDGASQDLLQARTLTRPSWSGDAGTLYAVADGREVKRFVRSGQTGRMIEEPVNGDALKKLGKDARISMFRLSKDGVRALMVIDGRVYVSVLHEGERGGVRLGELQEVGYQLGDTAVSAAWEYDGAILVGTRATEAPVWRLAVDGSVTQQESARNIAAPVVAVASSAKTIYATDGRAMVMLNRDDSEPKYWREVPGLVGQRAIPVIAN